MFWFYQSILGIFNVNIRYNGFVSAGFNLVSLLLVLNIKKIEKKFGVPNSLFYSALLPGLFFLGLFFFRNIYFALIAIFVITSLKGFREPILSDFMNRHIDSRNRATILSGVSMLEKLIIMILYPLVGLIADFSLFYTFLPTFLLILT